MEQEHKKHRGRRRRQKRYDPQPILFLLFTLLLVGVCTTVMFGYIFMRYVETNVMPVVQVDADDYTMELSSIIYYQDDEATENEGWTEYATVHGEQNRIWVDMDQIPDALWQAAVAIEDHRFFQHKGVDWTRTSGAVLNMFIGMRNTFGGSSITQQLLKNMTEDNDGTVNRKVREIFRALAFEENYTKEQILELYLNTIYLGKGCYGVQTAAQFYFGKDVSELSTAECASLIAITNNPSMYGPMYNIEITVKQEDGTTAVMTPRQLNKKRQVNILNRMGEVGKEGTVKNGATPFLTKEQVEAAKAEELQFTDGTTQAGDIVAKAIGGIKINNWFVDQVIWDVSADLAKTMDISEKEARILINNSGYRIYTTVNPEIQSLAESVYRNRSNLDVTSRNGQQLQSGITIMDPYTGNIVAIVGKVGEKAENLGFSCATAKRQPGSSIKPLTVYAPAVEASAVNPATTFDDYPVRLLENTPWPKNSPNKYRGWVNVRTGVQHSINTVALQTLEKVGLDTAFAFATESLGLSLAPEDMDVSPLSMGGLTYGLNTVEMAAAYAAFANNGIYNTPRTYLRVEDAEGNVILENQQESHVGMKESTAYLMNDMLKNAVNYGTGSSAKFNGMNIAGKTGTTSNNHDRYFVGYTPYYVAAVWTGYETPEKISYSGNPAITMWKKVMEPIHKKLASKDFQRPTTGLENVTVCADSGLLCGDACGADPRGNRAISIWVAEGTAPTETCSMHVFRSYCTGGKCLATSKCPSKSVKDVGLLNHVRQDYGSGIKAEDSSYVISELEKTMGLKPTYTQNGTAVYPKVIGCPAHASLTPEPEPESPSTNPDDPNLPPPEGEDNDFDWGWGDTDLQQPTQPPKLPDVPNVPQEPDVSAPPKEPNEADLNIQ